MGESLADDPARQRTIDRFLDDLDGMAESVPRRRRRPARRPARRRPARRRGVRQRGGWRHGGRRRRQPTRVRWRPRTAPAPTEPGRRRRRRRRATRRRRRWRPGRGQPGALAAARHRAGPTDRPVRAPSWRRWPTSSRSVTALLDREGGLRRALADSSAEPDRRQALFDRVLGSQLDAPDRGAAPTAGAGALVRGRATWPTRSSSWAAGPRSGVAERDGSLDDVEDELFRFGRILEARAAAAADAGGPVDAGASGGSSCSTGSSATGSTRPPGSCWTRRSPRPRGQHLERTVTELVELAAARRERYVAYVTAPAPLTDEQETPAGGRAGPHLRPAGLAAGRRWTRSCSAAWWSR